MKRGYLVLLTLAIGIGVSPSAHSIENGKDATGNSHVVRVLSKYNKAGQLSSCSGGVLSEFVIVTAAHCIVDETGLLSKEIWALAPGSFTRRNSNGAFIQDSSWIPIDGAKTTLTFQLSSTGRVSNDDLAFLVLTRSVPLEVKTFIPSEDETAKLKESNATLLLYGYGHTSDSGNMPDTPSYFVASFDSVAPASIKNSGYASSMNSSACRGDSGGPVLSVTTTSVTVVGVITGGPSSNYCGKKLTDGKFYTLFTYLSRYANLAFAAASDATALALSQSTKDLDLLEETAQQVNDELSSAEEKNATLTQALENAMFELQAMKDQVLGLQETNQSLSKQLKRLNSKFGRTIVCKKGNLRKNVLGIDPKCPSGYKRVV